MFVAPALGTATFEPFLFLLIKYDFTLLYYIGCGGHTEHAEAEAGREEVPAALLQSQPFLRYQI